MNRKAFTLTELLITVAVLSILVALLLPALGRARKTAERTVCVNNLKQMGFATHAYAGDFDDCVPARIPQKNWSPVTGPRRRTTSRPTTEIKTATPCMVFCFP